MRNQRQTSNGQGRNMGRTSSDSEEYGRTDSWKRTRTKQVIAGPFEAAPVVEEPTPRQERRPSRFNTPDQGRQQNGSVRPLSQRRTVGPGTPLCRKCLAEWELRQEQRTSSPGIFRVTQYIGESVARIVFAEKSVRAGPRTLNSLLTAARVSTTFSSRRGPQLQPSSSRSSGCFPVRNPRRQVQVPNTCEYSVRWGEGAGGTVPETAQFPRQFPLSTF